MTGAGNSIRRKSSPASTPSTELVRRRLGSVGALCTMLGGSWWVPEYGYAWLINTLMIRFASTMNLQVGVVWPPWVFAFRACSHAQIEKCHALQHRASTAEGVEDCEVVEEWVEVIHLVHCQQGSWVLTLNPLPGLTPCMPLNPTTGHVHSPFSTRNTKRRRAPKRHKSKLQNPKPF